MEPRADSIAENGVRFDVWCSAILWFAQPREKEGMAINCVMACQPARGVKICTRGQMLALHATWPEQGARAGATGPMLVVQNVGWCGSWGCRVGSVLRIVVV